jgi:hypothetical protein
MLDSLRIGVAIRERERATKNLLWNRSNRTLIRVFVGKKKTIFPLEMISNDSKDTSLSLSLLLLLLSMPFQITLFVVKSLSKIPTFSLHISCFLAICEPELFAAALVQMTSVWPAVSSLVRHFGRRSLRSSRSHFLNIFHSFCCCSDVRSIATFVTSSAVDLDSFANTA